MRHEGGIHRGVNHLQSQRLASFSPLNLAREMRLARVTFGQLFFEGSAPQWLWDQYVISLGGSARLRLLIE